MLKNLVRLAIFLLFANALYQFVPVYMHYYQFKDAVAETAMFAKDRSDADLKDRVMVLAQRFQIPLDPEAVQITRDKQMTYITLVYEEEIHWAPAYKRVMPFHVAAEGWNELPSTRANPR
jgi:hypothetical protein